MIKFIIDKDQIKFTNSTPYITYTIGEGLLNFASFDFNEINNYMKSFAIDKIKDTNIYQNKLAITEIREHLTQMHPFFHFVSDKYIIEIVLMYLAFLLNVHKDIICLEKPKFGDSKYNLYIKIADNIFKDFTKVDSRTNIWLYFRDNHPYNFQDYTPLYELSQLQDDVLDWIVWILDLDFNLPSHIEMRDNLLILSPEQRMKLYFDLRVPYKSSKNYDFLDDYELYSEINIGNGFHYMPNINYIYDISNNDIDSLNEYSKASENMVRDNVIKMTNLLSNINVNFLEEYSVNKIQEILYIELLNMIKNNVKMRKCNNCNKYFILKNNHNSKYCDRIQPNGNSCKRIGALNQHYKNIRNNPVSDLYRKEYFKNLARRNRSMEYEANLRTMPEGTVKKLKTYISLEDYDKWVAMASELKKKALRDEISIEEFKNSISLEK